MTSIEAIYGGNYLSAKSVISKGLAGQTLEIYVSELEQVGSDDKVVLQFKDHTEKLPLNKTNATILADKFGDDFGQWKGKKLTLRLTKRNYQGNLVDAIEVVPLD